MARITMKTAPTNTVEELFPTFLSAAAARGVKDKTLDTYKQHFRAISKRLDVTVPINRLNKPDLDNMILKMREERLSASSINSYTRTLKVFFSWCNEESYTTLNIKLFKAPETVKEVYTDEELSVLLKKPAANCNFCEFRNWFIVDFLLNSGCRAATVRNIQIQDVDRQRRQIAMRHSKNGRVQFEIFITSADMTPKFFAASFLLVYFLIMCYAYGKENRPFSVFYTSNVKDPYCHHMPKDFSPSRPQKHFFPAVTYLREALS